jgi:hypothetical protein
MTGEFVHISLVGSTVSSFVAGLQPHFAVSTTEVGKAAFHYNSMRAAACSEGTTLNFGTATNQLPDSLNHFFPSSQAQPLPFKQLGKPPAMSELNSRSRFLPSDWQHQPLPTTSLFDDVMDPTQVTSNFPPNVTPQFCGGNSFVAPVQSRDWAHSAAPPAPITNPSAAWSCPGFSAIGNGLSDIGNTGSTDFAGFTSSFTLPGDFQSWPTQQPPGVDDWSSILDPRFFPSLDANPAR